MNKRLKGLVLGAMSRNIIGFGREVEGDLTKRNRRKEKEAVM